jgi:rhomboid protease GluP
VKTHYARYVGEAAYDDALMPDDQVPRKGGGTLAQAEALVARYPHDPRAHLFRALELAKQAHYLGAEQAVRRGLEQENILAHAFTNRELEIAMRGFLAELLLARGDRQGAKVAAAPVCSAGPGSSVPESLRELEVCN